MDNDDRPIGRVLSRREVLALLGVSAASLVVGCSPTQSSAPTQLAAPPTSEAPLSANQPTVVGWRPQPRH